MMSMQSRVRVVEPIPGYEIKDRAIPLEMFRKEQIVMTIVGAQFCHDT